MTTLKWIKMQPYNNNVSQTIPIRTHVIKFAALLAFVFLTAGCAMSKPPLQKDQSYPVEWPDISSLGLECKGLDGAYANKGTVNAAGKGLQTILLTSILPVNVPMEAKSVSLKIVTRKIDSHQDTFATLQITVGDGKKNQYEWGDCYCVKRALFYSPSQEYWAFPPVFGGSQRNVWLTKATDGSLIARIWDYSGDSILFVPFHRRSYVWARFKSIVD